MNIETIYHEAIDLQTQIEEASARLKELREEAGEVLQGDNWEAPDGGKVLCGRAVKTECDKEWFETNLPEDEVEALKRFAITKKDVEGLILGGILSAERAWEHYRTIENGWRVSFKPPKG